MGAILLYRKDDRVSEKDALALLRKKGFSEQARFEYGQWYIYAMPKIIGSFDNYINIGNTTLICVGTPVYKGLNYKSSLHELLMDYCHHELQFEDLFGQYTIFFCRQDKISILADPLNTKHLFIDSNNCIISSSFLAVVNGLREKVHINKPAVYEKLLTGFIMKPNTIFKEIKQLQGSDWDEKDKKETCLSFISNPTDLLIQSEKKNTRKQCVQEQTQSLLCYFEKLTKYSSCGIDIGISGGYDSRLALACMNACFHDKVHIHTHSTESVHKKDNDVAFSISQRVNIPCHIVPTKQLIHCANIDEILEDCVLYFDGRTSFSIGGCGEVYTLDYRKSSTEKTPMTVSGVGGELYRNMFNIGGSKIRLRSFLRQKVFSEAFRKGINPEVYDTVSNQMIARIAKKLGVMENEKVSKAVAHRYYCEIMMPDGQGNAVDAYNQVSCCVAPFLEPSIINKGYESIPFHGYSGDFEGAVIDSIDHDLASINSAYGYPLNHRPVTVRAKEFLRSIAPNFVWERMGEIKNKSSETESMLVRDLEIICHKSEKLRNALKKMTNLFPEINFTFLIENAEGNKRVIFLAMTFDLLSERIEMNE